jgi:hypothetical protein
LAASTERCQIDQPGVLERLVMQRFMQDKNLSLFLRRLLAEQKEMDEERRQVIFDLLAKEEAKVDRGSQRLSEVDFPHAP